MHIWKMQTRSVEVIPFQHRQTVCLTEVWQLQKSVLPEICLDLNVKEE